MMMRSEFKPVKYSTYTKNMEIPSDNQALHCTWQRTVPTHIFSGESYSKKNLRNSSELSLKVFLTWPLMTSLSPGRMLGVFSSVRHFSMGPICTRLREKIDDGKCVFLQETSYGGPVLQLTLILY